MFHDCLHHGTRVVLCFGIIPTSALWSYLLFLSFSSPGDLPDPGTEPRSLALEADSLLSEPPGPPTLLLPLIRILVSTLNCVIQNKSRVVLEETLFGNTSAIETGTPLQYSCLENPMDGGAWWTADHGVTKSPERLSDFTFTFHFHALEKETATHSSVFAWGRIPGTGEAGGLPSMGLHSRTQLKRLSSSSSMCNRKKMEAT